MTDHKHPDDRELEQYLHGDSPLSRRYRDASGEAPPPELDEAILAQARAELKRKPPSASRYLAPVALAASVVLAVNLAWNLHEVEPVPSAAQRLEKTAEPAYTPDPPAPPEQAPAASAPAPMAAPPEAKRRAPQVPSAKLEERLPAAPEVDAAARERELAAAQARNQAAAQARSEESAAVARKAQVESQRQQSLQAADAAGGPAALAAAPPMAEAAKIDRLIAYVSGLPGAVFIRNGREHSAEDAAGHMRLKRDKAGERCDTAEEFVRVCASFSSRSGEAYLIRFPDGRTRTAEDVLREELARLEAN